MSNKIQNFLSHRVNFLKMKKVLQTCTHLLHKEYLLLLYLTQKLHYRIFIMYTQIVGAYFGAIPIRNESFFKAHFARFRQALSVGTIVSITYLKAMFHLLLCEQLIMSCLNIIYLHLTIKSKCNPRNLKTSSRC